MAWAAFDRGVRSIEEFGFVGPLDHWRRLRQQIHDDVCAKGFDSELNAFTQSYGGKELDASLLLTALLGFLPTDDKRLRGTVEAIERLLIVDGLVQRYDTRTTKDVLTSGEGAFLACSFWLVDNLVLLGRLDDARRLFEQLLMLRNDLGLLAEEYDPQAQRLVGNYPQAFSHIALINSAYNLARAAKPAEQRSGAKAQPAQLKTGLFSLCQPADQPNTQDRFPLLARHALACL
jgi:GH15 family glucan-1,4-alpha-glucosidase